MGTPHRQDLANARWTVRAVGDLSGVPVSVRGRLVQATVPGCVHTDLMDAGLIPDPAVGMNEQEVQWVSWTDWRYECEFEAEAALFEHHEIHLVFECLDTIAVVELNGDEIGRATSEFVPHRFSVLGLLRAGVNRMAVTFASPLRFVQEESKRLGARPYNGDEQGWAAYNVIRKCASNFGWDWGPRVATCGVSARVCLHGWSEARFGDVRVALSKFSNIEVPIVWADGKGHSPGLVTELEVRDLEGTTVFEEAGAADPECDEVSFLLMWGEAREWWPSGRGGQHLYNVTVRMKLGQVEIDHWEQRMGFRHAGLNYWGEQYPGQFAIHANEEPIFCRGANWIPEGLWPRDRTKERVRVRLQQAVDANMNMIRVWGGGRYEPDWFYDLCDEMGLMVWQDFMFACACYPEEEPLRSLIEQEARHQVARLSRHPCVVLWCGGNECHWAYESWGFKERLRKGSHEVTESRSHEAPVKTWGRHYWREMLPRIVREVDGTRPYWPDSPWSGVRADGSEVHPNDAGHGDRHTWDVMGPAFRGIVPRFCSEFGVQSPSNLETLKEAGLVGTPSVSEGGSVVPSELLARQRGAGGMERWYGEVDKEEGIQAARHQGIKSKSKAFEEWHARAQAQQAEWLKIAIEWLLANKDRCSGALIWQLNDAWPGFSWSLIDSAGREKPAYWAVRAAFEGRGCRISSEMGSVDIDALLKAPESFRVEMTASTSDTDKFCEAICAFANDMAGSGQPGYLLIGVDKQGRPSGARVDDRLLETLAGLRDNGNILPLPTMNVQRTPVGGVDIAVVEVFPSDSPPVRYKQVVWIRTGPSKDRASAEQERRLEERRVDRARTWDMRACVEASLADLALDIFTLNYLSRAVSQQVLADNGRTIEEQLGSLRFFHKKLNAPTNAAVLLFGKDPLAYFPGAYIQYVRYDGPSQASSPLHERRISGELLTVLRELDGLARSLAVQRPVRSEQLAESLVSEYPEVALHELFVNAVIHRNYDGSTTPVSVNHFSDRIEIQNPGSLYGDLARDDFPGGTAYRNPVLAEAAKTLGFANRFGRGITLAQDQLLQNGSPPAEFIVGENHIAVIVRKRS